MSEGRLVMARYWRLFVCLSLLPVGVLAGQSTDGPADPFAWSHARFAPENLGLAVGSAAPDAKGIAWEGRRSVALVAPTGLGEAIGASARAWSVFDGLQIAVFLCAAETADDRAFAQATFGDGVTVVASADAAAAARGFGVKDDSEFAAVFLVDERRTVVHRLWNPSERHIPELTQVVRFFALTGAVPPDAVREQPLRLGDLAPELQLPLEMLSGEEARIERGRACLLFSGAPVAEGQSAGVRHELDLLRGEFPEVDFVWLLPYASMETCRAIWQARQEFGWTARGLLTQQLDAYLGSCAQNESDWREVLCSLAEGDASGWRILLDRDYRVQRLWMLYGAPTVFVLDREGRVVFPCSFYVADRASGATVFPARALDALRDVLREVVP